MEVVSVEVSRTQRRYLERVWDAMRRRLPEEAWEYVLTVASDDDIEAGREALDPAWADVWDLLAPMAERFAPADLVRSVGERMGRVMAVDEDVWDVRLAEGQSAAVLLGAGASVPEPSGLPTVTGLLPELWKRAAKLGREDLESLSTWCRDNGIRNIEDLLTAAYIANFAARNSGVLSLLDYFLFHRQREAPEPRFSRFARSPAAPQADVAAAALFQDTLQTLFALLTGTMIAAAPNAAHKAVAGLASSWPKTAVLTTNYDSCVDEALEGAGLPLDYLLEEPSGEARDAGLELLKMHGSVNWFFCDSCQSAVHFPLKEVRRAYQEETLSYPVIGICRECGGQRRPMILPPLSFKFLMFPALTGVWERARVALAAADLILVVGYSFSEADTYLTNMVTRAIASGPHKRMIVVDESPALVPRLRSRFSALIDGFDESRLMQVTKSCDEVLPKLVESLLRRRKSEERAPRPAEERAPAAGDR